MEKNRLARLLRTFSPDELRGLKKFAQSVLAVQRPEVGLLLDVLAKPLHFIKKPLEINKFLKPNERRSGWKLT